jgi:hypothetical protein
MAARLPAPLLTMPPAPRTHTWQHTQTRQALGVDGSGFEPISLLRYSRALDDAVQFAEWLAAYRAAASALQASVSGARARVCVCV